MIIDEDEREKKRIRLEAEKSQKEEDFRRQEAEKRELEKSEKQRRELLEWLIPFDYNSKHQSSTQLRQEGTCGWLLENATFKDWRSGSGSSSFLWLYGIRKSLMYNYIISILLITRSWKWEDHIIVRICYLSRD